MSSMSDNVLAVTDAREFQRAGIAKGELHELKVKRA